MELTPEEKTVALLAFLARRQELIGRIESLANIPQCASIVEVAKKELATLEIVIRKLT